MSEVKSSLVPWLAANNGDLSGSVKTQAAR